MAPAPCRGIGDTQVVLELMGRRVLGSGRHLKDCPEPVPQGISGLVEDGMGSERVLMGTVLALILSPRADEIGLIMVTARTAETIRSFALDKISQVIALDAKPASELTGWH